jgi:CRISPR/Cas system-associated exonuclease Cas4 (RecB family)
MAKDHVPPHFSYSSLSSYMQCGQRYFLEKIARVPEVPSWWFVGGRAVHEVTEIYDVDRKKFEQSGLDQLWTEVFSREVAAQSVKFPDLTQWRTAGKKKALPDGEDYLAWMDIGPRFVQNYIDWQAQIGLTIWDDAIVDFDEDTGEAKTALAVELPIDVSIGGWQMKGSVDRVYVHPNGVDLIVVDLKTGSRMPDNDLQLGTYSVGMEIQYGIKPKYGMYFMNRTNKASQLFELENYTVDSLASMGIQLRSGIKNKVFLPHKSALCPYCPVNAGCAAFGGKDAALYQIEKVLPSE